MPVLACKGGAFAKGAVEEEEEVELVEEDGHEGETRREVDLVRPVLIGEIIEESPGAEGEDDGDHGDARVEQKAWQARAAGEVEEIDVEKDGGKQLDELLNGEVADEVRETG